MLAADTMNCVRHGESIRRLMILWMAASLSAMAMSWSQAARQGLAVLMASAVYSSAKTWNFNPSPKAQFYINWFQIWRGWLR